MRCSALVSASSLGIRANSDRTLQCRRNAKEGTLCRQHAGMPRIYCEGVLSFLMRRAHRYYCSRCAKRFPAIYSDDG